MLACLGLATLSALAKGTGMNDCPQIQTML